ncbi:hypothetical protein ACFY8C_31050 [Streptomyces flavochromogenes]|uniref:Uncharacterized protein n=1 Tax=Streptomyces flavochromogenes TaxID=68199 RepID=A0ABW6XYZ1_9ACTN|nr:hypothetical protein [Streptomyces flavochromogenes]
MHEPDTFHDWVDDDFGATALGSSYHNDWSRYTDDPIDHALNYLGPTGDPAFLILLIEDLQRLFSSPLSGEELGRLWGALGDPLGASPAFDGAERPWFHRLLEAVTRLAVARGAREAQWADLPGCSPEPTGTVAAEHQRLVPEVLGVAGLLDQGRVDDRGPALATRSAIERCVTLVCPELAFRFLLHALGRFGCSLSPADYTRLRSLSSAFGHGPFVVSAHRNLLG